jgi:predicted amidohydrolase YtcJ
VYGRGWDEEELEEKRPPTRKELDIAVSDRPAVIVRVCGHMGVANSLALELTRPWEQYPGFVDREHGVLVEDALYYVLEKLLENVPLDEYVSVAVKKISDAGIAAVSSMSCTLNELKALVRLDSRRSLSIRVSCYMNPADFPDSLNIKSPNVESVGIKLFSDGSLGAHTAYLSEPYNDKPDTRGRLLLTSKEIVEQSKPVLESGYRVATHAIGDAALDEVLKAYEVLQPGGKGRIEHVSLARTSQISRLASLRVHAVVQPRFRISDWWIRKRLGERTKYAYKFRSLLMAGVNLALSTDSPVEPVEPWLTFYASSSECGECVSGEPLDWRDALQAYTVNSVLARWTCKCSGRFRGG